jgi:hypothetical protein
MNGFRKGGIYPLDRSVLRNHDFEIYVEEEGEDCDALFVNL